MKLLKRKRALGIQDISYMYLILDNENNRLKEYLDTTDFLVESAKKFGIIPSSLKFINWGHTELVFVGKDKLNRLKTILVSQPTANFGQIKEEVNNLIYLSKNNPQNVVLPDGYFGDENVKKEMYITPYYYQARCISCTDKWGQYVPEPNYHFETFSNQKQKIVNSCMIAKIISMYNEKDCNGLASIELVNGDFILLKNLDTQELNYNNVLKNMKLIAARKLVKMPFDEYVTKLTKEFSTTLKIERKTSDGEVIVNDSDNIINKRTHLPLSMQEIKEGISIGMKLRKQAKEDVER